MSNGESNTPTEDNVTPQTPAPTPSPVEESPAQQQADAIDEDDNIGNLVSPPTSADATPDDEDTPGNAIPDARRNRKNRGGGRGEGPRAEAGAPGNQGGKPSAPKPPRHQDPNQHRAFKVGDKVRAKILTFGAGGALVDLWGKEKGVLDLRELQGDMEGAHVGDSVDVVVLQDGTRGGNLVVTRDADRGTRNREMLVQAFNAGEAVEGLITGLNRGGLEVDISGIRGFCPSSQIDIRVPSNSDLQGMVLRRELFKVTSLVGDGREAVVSRRALREADVRERAEQAASHIKVGDRVTGRVVAVKEHGIFVDLGGVEGRIQLSELSHDRSARPSDIAKVGDAIEAIVLRIDVPQAAPPHAQTAPSQPPAEQPPAEGGAPAEGAAPNAESNGEDKGGRDKKKKPPQRFSRLPEGTPRVELSHRAVEQDPWAEVHKRYPVGSVHKGKVARMQPFGAFIELERGIDGLLHVSEIGDRRIQHPNEVLKEAQEVTVRVGKIDKGQRRIALSLLPEGVTEEQLKQSITPRPGMVANAKVIEHDSAGIWAQLDGTFGKIGRGFIAPQDSNQPKGTDLRKALPLGTDVKVKIVEMDRGRIKLSIRAALQDEERQAYRAYQQQANATSVGVSLADKLRKLNLPRSGE